MRCSVLVFARARETTTPRLRVVKASELGEQLVRERVRLALAELTRELVAAERSRTRSRSLSLA